MLNSIFPITENWSWLTFFLYLLISFITVRLCQKGVMLRDTCNNTINSNSNRKVEAGVCFFLVWIILVSLATFRDDSVGIDTKYYLSYFQSQTNVNYDWKSFFTFQQKEPGFQYYLYYVRLLTNNYTYLFFFTYGIVAYAYIYFIKNTWKVKDDFVFLWIYIYYYMSNMSGMRSAIGLSFLLVSYVQLERKKYINSVILTIIGLLFHYTMLFNLYVIVLHWLLSSKKMREKKYIWILSIAFTIVFANYGIYVLKRVMSGTKYDYYSVDLAETSILGSMFLVILAVLCLYFYKEIINKNNVAASNMIICMSILAAYPLLYVTGAYRIPHYYIMPRLYIWSLIVEEIRKRTSPKVFGIMYEGIKVIVILYLLMRFTKTSVNGSFIYHIK